MRDKNRLLYNYHFAEGGIQSLWLWTHSGAIEGCVPLKYISISFIIIRTHSKSNLAKSLPPCPFGSRSVTKDVHIRAAICPSSRRVGSDPSGVMLCTGFAKTNGIYVLESVSRKLQESI